MLGGKLCANLSVNLFPTLDEIREASITTLPSRDDGGVDFREWIFPNHFRFPCSVNITGWIFRSDAGISDFLNRRLPRWSVYNLSVLVPDPSLYRIVNESGSSDELREIEPGLYQYTLQTTLAVKFGNILGIRYEQDGLPFFPVGFQDLGTGSDISTASFRRTRLGSVLFDTRSTVTTDTQYLPLVTVLVGELCRHCNNSATPSTMWLCLF